MRVKTAVQSGIPMLYINNNHIKKVTHPFYKQPTKGLLLIQDPNEIMDELESHDISRVLKNLIAAIKQQFANDWPVFINGTLDAENPYLDEDKTTDDKKEDDDEDIDLDGNNEEKVDKNSENAFPSKATKEDWQLWEEFFDLLIDNQYAHLVTSCDTPPKNHAYKKLIMPTILKHKCNYVWIGGVNETACCYAVGRMLARYLWATVITEDVFPGTMPDSARYMEDVDLIAIVDPAITADVLSEVERYRDLQTEKPAWVCFQGKCDSNFQDAPDDGLCDVEELMEQLNALQTGAKRDNKGNWYAEAWLNIDYISGPLKPHDSDQDEKLLDDFLNDED